VRIVLILFAPILFAAGDHTADEFRDLPFKCSKVLENARLYFSTHGFTSGLLPSGELKLYPDQHPLEASGNRISLNRFRISKYVRDGQVSPFRIYTGFSLEGTLVLVPLSETCRMTLSLTFSAYEWSPFLVVDGSGQQFVSNGRLERQYLNAISDRLDEAKSTVH
jgi:hypothetical protein